MSKSVFKKIVSIVLASVLICAFFQFVGCYRTLSGKKEDILGTYKLVRKTEGRDSSGEAIDLIELNGIVEYIVVGDDGKGFRIYDDNTVEPSCTDIRIDFYKDEENPELYNYIEYKTYPGSSAVKLGYHAGEKMLNFGTPSISSGCINLKESSIAYKKVSDDKTLAFVQSEMNMTFKYTPYELFGMNKITSGSNLYIQHKPQTEEFTTIPSDYVYFLIELDIENSMAKINYMLKADEQEVELNLPYTYTVNPPIDEYSVNTVTLNVGEFEFIYSVTGSSALELKVVKGEIEYQLFFWDIVYEVEEHKQSKINEYHNSEEYKAAHGSEESGENGGEESGENGGEESGENGGEEANN